MKTIQQLAKEACDVQDACNLMAVVLGMERALRSLQNDHDMFGDKLRSHPVARAWADKVASLAGVQSVNANAMLAHGDCEKLARS